MRFKFDRFVIDGGRRIMWRGDEEVHVAPKTLDFLLSLLAQAPNAVSKTELMATLWPDTHIAEATLTGVVADAREALGDDGRAPRLIRTLHRFGYSFTGQVEREVSVNSDEPVLGWLIADTWRLPLRSGETILGREGDGVVPLPSPSVSRQHAALDHGRHGRAVARSREQERDVRGRDARRGSHGVTRWGATALRDPPGDLPPGRAELVDETI